ncbi:MAG: phosphoribosylformylglycinamidine synthase subunit PurS [Sulfolobaceae archaeon]
MFIVELLIYTKDGVRDPEGETIYRYMVSKVSSLVKEVRAGKYLRFTLDVESKEKAIEEVVRVSNELMLYNPLVHKIEVRIRDSNS